MGWAKSQYPGIETEITIDDPSIMSVTDLRERLQLAAIKVNSRHFTIEDSIFVCDSDGVMIHDEKKYLHEHETFQQDQTKITLYVAKTSSRTSDPCTLKVIGGTGEVPMEMKIPMDYAWLPAQAIKRLVLNKWDSIGDMTRIRLIYAGKQLEDKRALVDYGCPTGVNTACNL